MLLPLNFDNIPNYQYMDEAYKNTAYDPDNLYSVPYTWGTVGIIYNSALRGRGGCRQLGSSAGTASMPAKILMFDNPRDAFAIAESHARIHRSTRDDEDELRAAAYKLIEQKPLVQAYVMDQIYDKMERGEAWIAPYYAGDYLMMVRGKPGSSLLLPGGGLQLLHRRACASPRAQRTRKARRLTSTSCARRR